MKNISAIILLLLMAANAIGETYKLPDTPISTEWAEKITPENVHQEYPRPQHKRNSWKNLNGLWNYALTDKSNGRPNAFKRTILVPFAIQAPLSGVEKELTADTAIWYQREISIPKNWKGKNVLLNFEASDWETTVWVNDVLIGKHTGGYTPFSMDITEGLKKGKKGKHNLVVKVWDHQGTMFTSEGKQKNGHYVTVSGLWQTVWMEPVSDAHLEALKITTSMYGDIHITPSINGNSENTEVEYKVLFNDKEVAFATAGSLVSLKIDEPQLWSPETPNLYTIKATLKKNGKTVDVIESYAGLRTIELVDSEIGKQFYLNGKRMFQMGPLDQNYWPGGGLTAPSDEANAWEIQYLKDIGCNMVRLHIKQNARRWYYHCDTKGLLVWQDFICGPRKKVFKNVSFEEMSTWMDEQKSIVDNLYNSPSVVMWVVFNEAWGQFHTKKVLDWSMTLDTTRVISVASGWYDLPQEGHVRDVHDYTFRPSIPALGTDMNRLVILGECGGFASAVPDNNWTGRTNNDTKAKNALHGGFDPTPPRDNNKKHDIFRPTFTYGNAFEKNYGDFVDNLLLMQNNGLVGAVYTQFTDMKFEENGYLTFDRKVSKMDKAKLKAMHNKLYGELPSQSPIINSGLTENTEWMYTVQPQSSNDWLNTEKTDIVWQNGAAPFVVGEVNEFKNGTVYNADTLYLKKKFSLTEIPNEASLRVYVYAEGTSHNEWNYAQIYINGVMVKDEATRLFMPELRVAEIKLHPKDIALLKEGENTIAVKVKPNFNIKNFKLQKKSNQLFDISLMRIE